MESALLLVCPSVEDAIGSERASLDLAAQDGIPAHITVVYPFQPAELMTAEDHRRLEDVVAGSGRLVLRLSEVRWFGASVLFLALEDPDPITHLIRAVSSAFPDYPPYAGRYAEPTPHLTIGHNQPVDELQAAAQSVSRRLPLTQELDHVELWTGPAVDGRSTPAPWRRVRDYQFRG
jgi:2'-5' RNA ligase